MSLTRRVKKAISDPTGARDFISKSASEYRHLALERRLFRIISKTVDGFIGYNPYVAYHRRNAEGRYHRIGVRDFEMIVDLDDTSVGADLLVYEDREATLAAEYERLIEELQAPTIMDIGSNIGYYVCLAGTRDVDTMIHAFEPEPNNIELLKQNVDLNGINEEVIINETAVSDDSGTVELSIDESSNAHSLHTTTGDTVAVDMTTIDRYCEQNKISPDEIDVVRMDIEGAEIDALRGMTDLFETSPPSVLFVEVHARHLTEKDHAELFTLLNDYNYTIELAISEAVISSPWPGSYDLESPDELLEMQATYGIIAVRCEEAQEL